MFLNLIDIKVSGRNPEKIIKKLKDKNIDIYNIKYVKYNLIILRIKKEDYNNLDYLKVLYDIEIIEFYGIDKIKYLIKKNIYLLISIFISISVLILLTNTIFDVSVIHNNKSIRDKCIETWKEFSDNPQLLDIKNQNFFFYFSRIYSLNITFKANLSVVKFSKYFFLSYKTFNTSFFASSNLILS